MTETILRKLLLIALAALAATAAPTRWTDTEKTDYATCVDALLEFSKGRLERNRDVQLGSEEQRAAIVADAKAVQDLHKLITKTTTLHEGPEWDLLFAMASGEVAAVFDATAAYKMRKQGYPAEAIDAAEKLTVSDATHSAERFRALSQAARER